MVLHIQFSNSYVWKKCILEIFCVAIPIFQYVSLSLPKFSRIPYYFRCCCCPASVAGLCLDCSNFGYGQWWQVIDKNRVDHPLDSPFSETALFVSLPKDINGEKSIRLPFWGVILNGELGAKMEIYLLIAHLFVTWIKLGVLTGWHEVIYVTRVHCFWTKFGLSWVQLIAIKQLLIDLVAHRQALIHCNCLS